MIVRMEFDLNPILKKENEQTKEFNQAFEREKEDLNRIMLVNLMDLMKEKGLSDYLEISEATGISYTSLWELVQDGMMDTSFSTLLKLVNYFDCSISDLLMTESEKQIKQTKAHETKREIVVAMMKLKLALED